MSQNSKMSTPEMSDKVPPCFQIHPSDDSKHNGNGSASEPSSHMNFKSKKIRSNTVFQQPLAESSACSNDDTGSMFTEASSGLKSSYLFVLLGDAKVGKSAFVDSLISGKHKPREYEPTAQSSRVISSFPLQGTSFKLDLTELGPEHPNYRDQRIKLIQDADAILLCYSVGNKVTFDSLSSNYKNVIETHKRPKAVVAIIGCRREWEDVMVTNEHLIESASFWSKSAVIYDTAMPTKEKPLNNGDVILRSVLRRILQPAHTAENSKVTPDTGKKKKQLCSCCKKKGTRAGAGAVADKGKKKKKCVIS